MKVYFDARMIDHPGIGRYIRCLLTHIAKDPEIDLILLGNRQKISNFKLQITDFKFQIIDFDYPIYSIQEQIGYLRLKKEIASARRLRRRPRNDEKKETGCILHIPHYNIPVLAKFNLVATVHDLIHIVYPEGASGRLAPMYMKFMMRRILKSARAVICVSQSTKNEIEERLLRRPKGLLAMTQSGGTRNDGAALEVVYEGVDKAFVKITDTAFLKSIKQKYNLPDKFILYVGSIRRHKNIGALLDAFEYFRNKNQGFKLVMVGRRSQGIEINREGVMYLGELASDKELAAMYNLASCLFNLSLYEGFGLTILEAQACGLPVVCSGIPVHNEIGGKGVLAVNPSYIDQIYENLYNVLFDDTVKKALISRGYENIRRFDWRSTARSTIEIYRKISDEGGDSSRLAAGNAGRGKDSQCFL